jgi:hypothetical protein
MGMSMDNVAGVQVAMHDAWVEKRVLRLILSHRIGWYNRTIAAYLKRYRHILLIALLLLLPSTSEVEMLIGLLDLIAMPLLNLALVGEAASKALAYLWTLSLIFSLWISLQREAILGEPFSTFLKTLPLDEQQTGYVDTVLVVLANNILWAFFIVPMLVVQYGDMDAGDVARFIVNCAVLIVYVHALQLFVLHRNYLSAVTVAIAYSLYFVLILRLTTYPGLVAGIFAVVGGLVLIQNHTLARRFSVDRMRFMQFGLFGKLSVYTHSLVTIYLRILLGKYWISTLIRLVSVVAVGVIVGAVLNNNLNNTQKENIQILIAYGVWSVFIVSGIYSHLYDERKSIMPFLKSLPTALLSWVFRDILVAYVSSMVLTVPLLVYLSGDQLISSIAIVLYMIYLVPLALLFYPVRTMMPRQGSVAAIVLGVVWISMALVLF